MRHASLFTGIGGFDLAAKWIGWENVFQCEIDPFCQQILKHHFPTAQLYGNIKETDFTQWAGRIDVLSGGFPCQPYSTAGKRLGKDDERHLWPEMLRVIRQVQPPWVVGENVLGLVSWSNGLVFEEVCADLEAAGYEVQPFLLPAAGVDAPHLRDRIVFVAYSEGFRLQRDVFERERIFRGEQACGKAGSGDSSSGIAANTGCIIRHGWQSDKSGDHINHRTDVGWEETADIPERLRSKGITPNTTGFRNREQANETNSITDGGETRIKPCGTCRGGTFTNANEVCGRLGAGWKNREKADNGFEWNVTNTNSHQRPEGRVYPPEPETSERYACSCSTWGRGEAWENFPTQSPVCGGNDGLPRKLDGITFSKWRTESLKGYGNAVVPQMVFQVFKSIQEYENMKLWS